MKQEEVAHTKKINFYIYLRSFYTSAPLQPCRYVYLSLRTYIFTSSPYYTKFLFFVLCENRETFPQRFFHYANNHTWRMNKKEKKKVSSVCNILL